MMNGNIKSLDSKKCTLWVGSVIKITHHNSISLNSTACALSPAAGVSEETDLCTLLPSGDTSSSREITLSLCVRGEQGGTVGSELNGF